MFATREPCAQSTMGSGTDMGSAGLPRQMINAAYWGMGKNNDGVTATGAVSFRGRDNAASMQVS